MELIRNKHSISENKIFLDKIIYSKFNHLLGDSKKRQKVLELSHIGKFLMNYRNSFYLKELCESPDSIISDGSEDIGLEHQIIINESFKKEEGFWELILNSVEEELRKSGNIENFLISCSINPSLKFKQKDKKELIKTIKKIIEEYANNKYIIENPIISEISIMKHSKIALYPQFGGWWQQYISEEVILQSILKKEAKINKYRETGILKQWLLLVIGSLNQSSYEVNEPLEFEIKSKFDKIFLLEDFNNKLWVLK